MSKVHYMTAFRNPDLRIYIGPVLSETTMRRHNCNSPRSTEHEEVVQSVSRIRKGSAHSCSVVASVMLMRCWASKNVLHALSIEEGSNWQSYGKEEADSGDKMQRYTDMENNFTVILEFENNTYGCYTSGVAS
eukprot:scaffold3399_cov117-Cylindrotheca_fusiformis.AAC.10